MYFRPFEHLEERTGGTRDPLVCTPRSFYALSERKEVHFYSHPDPKPYADLVNWVELSSFDISKQSFQMGISPSCLLGTFKMILNPLLKDYDFDSIDSASWGPLLFPFPDSINKDPTSGESNQNLLEVILSRNENAVYKIKNHRQEKNKIQE